MLDNIRKKIEETDPFHQLKLSIGGLTPDQHLRLKSISGSLFPIVLNFILECERRPILLLVPDHDLAERLVDDCTLLVGPHQVFSFLHAPHHASTILDMSAPVGRIESLKALTAQQSGIFIATVDALAKPIPSPSVFAQQSFTLEAGKEYPFEQLLARLDSLGFERKDFVETYGDFAVRGGILDIYSFVGEHPLRIEFWGDTIESIREFDAVSQRSIRDLQSASIVSSLDNNVDKDNNIYTLFDYLDKNALLVIDDFPSIEREWKEAITKNGQSSLSWEFLTNHLKRYRVIEHERITSFSDMSRIDFQSTLQPVFQGAIKLLSEHIQRYISDGYDVCITCDTKDEALRIEELIEEEITNPDSPPTLQLPLHEFAEDTSSSFQHHWKILTGTLQNGFIYPPAKLVFLTEHEIFGRLKRRGRKGKPRFKGFTQKEARQLRRGDFVVHADFGIGRFEGLQTIKVRGVEQEVMRISYEDNDLVYVNLNYINRVKKYSSREGHLPKLTKLGTPQWDRLKSRARKKIKDIARDLISLYAQRKLASGISFSSDSHWQKEMEASFMYEDTPDQVKTIADVKLDMESASPMDRLICGDVGFGKTEIAVRVAFKAVLDGKQACLLVPTTILAQQHVNTFRDRIGRYAIRVDVLNRFRTKKDQTKILDDLQQGKIDIIIGTHRLLSKDVKFKDLGLLIVDEEHRFGVSAKEKIRQIKKNVDTLTLTATPIPRTLHFSLLGARDLSLINTPPRNRLPIHTEIAQFDLKLIREVILKEIHRGGQVYFIHDRVNNIEEIQSMLHRHIPEARFHIAHGQMKGHGLENTMMMFLEKKYDVLICTKIIESGIDIPSVNTIIINRADRFGLAELYQLRGRVGRSNIHAYAYLLTPPLSSLPRATLQRLQAIQEFTELGSGFNLAMRDLEIRGAGNLLGAEQSGFIMEMGFETYQKILEETVAELKEEEFSEMFSKETQTSRRRMGETTIETDIESLIPSIYIESDAERLDIYRRLYGTVSLQEVEEFRRELRDRFGEYPEEVESLFATVELKILASELGFRKVDLLGNEITLTFPSTEDKLYFEGDGSVESSFQTIMTRIQELGEFKPKLRQDGTELKVRAVLASDSTPRSRIEKGKEFLAALN